MSMGKAKPKAVKAKIEIAAIIVKLDNGNIHLVNTTDETMNMCLNFIFQKEGIITIIEPPIEGINFDKSIHIK
jgi:hypothetical protein